MQLRGTVASTLMGLVLATPLTACSAAPDAETTSSASGSELTRFCLNDEVAFPGLSQSTFRAPTDNNCNGRYSLQIDRTKGVTGSMTFSTCTAYVDVVLYGWNAASGWQKIGEQSQKGYTPATSCVSVVFDPASDGAFGNPVPNTFDTLLAVVTSPKSNNGFAPWLTLNLVNSGSSSIWHF